MNRIASLILILVANISLLAHSVIPHHHHDIGVVCLSFSECCTEKHSHGSDQDNCESHDHRGDSERCIINEAYAPSENTYRITCCHNTGDALSDLYFHDSTNYLPNPAIMFGVPLRQTPHPEAFISSDFSHSFGLRAPPVR